MLEKHCKLDTIVEFVTFQHKFVYQKQLMYGIPKWTKLCYRNKRHAVCKIQKILCYIENIETSCAKCTNIMRKMHKHHAQNTQTSCAKCTNIMRKIHKHHAQNTQTSCAKYTNVMQNAETLCSKMRKCYARSNAFKMRKRIADASSWLRDPDSN